MEGLTKLGEKISEVPPSSTPNDMLIVIFSAIGACLMYFFLADVQKRNQISATNNRYSVIETKLDTVIKDLAATRTELSEFIKSEVEILKEIARQKK